MASGGFARGPVALPSAWSPEVGALVRSLEDARYFRGSLVLVSGPPGVGKTRLIDAALAKALVSGRRIRRTFLEPRDVESPYKAVLSLARWAAKLEEIAPALDSGSLVLAPFVRALTSEPPGRRAPPNSSAGGERSPEYGRLLSDLEFYKRGVEAWGERSRFLHEVGWMILDAAARRHLVWVVESAQFLDPHSLAVIRYLAGCLDENPLVMWLNVDAEPDGSLPEPIRSLVGPPRSWALSVPRLTKEGVAELLEHKFPGRRFSDRVAEAVLAESQGLLMLAEQLADDPQLLRSRAQAGSTAPPNVLDVVMRKLDRLPATARELVRALAVVGEGVSLDLAVRISGRPAAAVEADLGVLVQEGFLTPAGPEGYCFRLTALPAAIEATLPAERQRELHRAAAGALATGADAPDDLLFDLADHWRRAEAWAEAATACLSAARFSTDTFAPEGGIVQAQRALEATRRAPSRRPELEAEALVEKGRALYDLGRLHESLAAAREAAELAQASPAVSALRARALFYEARALSSLARPQEAFEVVREALVALDTAKDPRAKMMLHQVVGVAFMMSDQNREAVEHFRPMLDLARSLNDPREVSYAQKNLSAVLLAIDPHDPEGWDLVNAALEHHRATNNFAGMSAGYLNRSMAKLSLGDASGAVQDLDCSREAGELAHAPLLIASATLQEASILLDRGEGARTDALLRGLAPWMPTVEEPATRVTFSLLSGRVAEAEGRPDLAEHCYEEAATAAEPAGESPGLWESRLRLAVLARRTGATERYERLRGSLPSVAQLAKAAPALVPLRKGLGRAAT